MANGPYKITEEFEKVLSEYTGAPYVATVDNMSNALFLTLIYQDIENKKVRIPSRTYPSVPCEIIRARGIVEFTPVEGTMLKGAYNLENTKTWDSALRFTNDMYIKDSFMCLSFTGPYKRLKLGKGGAILTDNKKAYEWFKRARFSGRRECSYFDDDFDMLGWNMYLLPELAARGLVLMNQFYDRAGNPISNEDLELPYPDLSKFEIYNENKV